MTYVSCLGYCHTLKDFSDPSKVFYDTQMLKGFNRIGFRLDSRLAITPPILDKLISVEPSLVGSPYQICQFQAMCWLAFFAFLRIGEMTSSSGRTDNPPLQNSHISKLLSSSSDLIAFRITFGSFKHSYNARLFSIVVSRQPQSCPVELLVKYLAMRGPRPSALFNTVDGLPVSRSQFSNQLSSAIQFCGLSPSAYKRHSFRIGAPSHAAGKGLSDAQIRLLGRWKSSAFLKYIRTPSLCS